MLPLGACPSLGRDARRILRFAPRRLRKRPSVARRHAISRGNYIHVRDHATWRRLIHRRSHWPSLPSRCRPSPASAAAASPVITGPVGTTSPDGRAHVAPVEGATGYEVRVDNDPAFGVAGVVLGHRQHRLGADQAPRPWDSSTCRCGPRMRRRRGATGRLSTFTVEAGPGPTLTGPDDGATLAQPADPPLLVWTPVAGAATYTVEVDTEAGFVSPDDLHHRGDGPGRARQPGARRRPTTGACAPTWPTASPPTSRPRTYEVAPDRDPRRSPRPTNDQDITDVVLDWSPVAGAKYYELQVDDDFDFGSRRRACPAKIYGTRFSPRRPSATTSTSGACAPSTSTTTPPSGCSSRRTYHYAFDRVWRDVPQLVHPYDAARDAGPVRRQRPLLRVGAGPARLALRGLAEHRPQLHRAVLRDLQCSSPARPTPPAS